MLPKREKHVKNKAVLKERTKTVTDDGCADCPALCCNDLVMLIDKPTTEDDLDTYLWYVQYDTSLIYILDDQWYHLVKGTCMYLDKKTKLCTKYETRPKKCRDHHPPDCERFGEWYDIVFETPEALEDYVRANNLIKKKVRKGAKKTKKTKKASGKKK